MTLLHVLRQTAGSLRNDLQAACDSIYRHGIIGEGIRGLVGKELPRQDDIVLDGCASLEGINGVVNRSRFHIRLQRVTIDDIYGAIKQRSDIVLQPDILEHADRGGGGRVRS